jgi:hypothetical protein
MVMKGVNMEDQVNVRSTLQKFQDGYTARDVTKLDEFMQLFVLDGQIISVHGGAGTKELN